MIKYLKDQALNDYYLKFSNKIYNKKYQWYLNDIKISLSLLDPKCISITIFLIGVYLIKNDNNPSTTINTSYDFFDQDNKNIKINIINIRISEKNVMIKTICDV